MFDWKRLFSWFRKPALSEPPCTPAYWTLQSVYLARAYYIVAELGIADLLNDHPMSVAELAETTHTHERSLFRILRALASFGVFAQSEDGRFAMTESAHALRSDIVGTMKDWTILVGSTPTWQSLDNALDVVRTGKSGFELAHGATGDLFEYCDRDEEFGKVFVRAMNNWTDWQRDVILAEYDFTRFKKVVDIGGGCGSFICGVLKQSPATRGVLFDREQSIEQARVFVEEEGVIDRCELVAGNFLKVVPEGGDAYVLKHTLRDWDDESVMAILRNCHAAMTAESRLLLIDATLDEANGKDRIGKLLDLEQMFWVSGALRTEPEWTQLLTTAGFEIVDTRRTSIVDATIIEARRR